MSSRLSISIWTILIIAICVVLALVTIIQSMSTISIDGGILALPTLYAIFVTSSNATKLNPGFLFVILGLIFNVILLTAIYFGVFQLLRWIFRKTRRS